ncbi:MAG: peptidoglycan-binding protein [Alphaproteobacteria bacterium]|nr:peptidoglycan-binding protein [Alphaproteobacteria bacterium]
MTLTSDQIRKVVGKSASQKIIDNVIESMDTYAAEFGLDRPERAVHFLAQIAHESAHFRTTTEYATGAAYEGRKDLGNVFKGDGRKFRGRGLIQLTGRSNTKTFTRWMRERDPGCPDFEANPEKLAEFPWAFLASVYYWSSRNLNRYADTNNIELITRRINGGLNGYADRLRYYDGFALAYLGYQISASGIREFQFDNGLETDGISGPVTRDAMHKSLKTLRSPSLPKVEIPPLPPTKPPASAPPGKHQSFWTRFAALLSGFFMRRRS